MSDDGTNPTVDRAAARLRAVSELVTAIERALAVCDALDDGFRTEWGTAAGTNLPELLADALTQVALRDGSYRLVQHRPGCWEAEHVRALDLSDLHRATG